MLFQLKQDNWGNGTESSGKYSPLCKNEEEVIMFGGRSN